LFPEIDSHPFLSSPITLDSKLASRADVEDLGQLFSIFRNQYVA
jgi:hypothetical protein